MATNWGLNTKYHVSEDHPLELYYDDFDRNGTLDIVEGHWDEEMKAMVPERGLSCLSNGIGYIGSQISTFKRFGDSNLEQIVGPALNDAPRVEAVVLNHMLFLSNNNGFNSISFPVEAQFSPAFGAVVADMDGDGHEDVFLSQNFFAYQIETSRSDAGRGLWLKGDGTGVLAPVPGQETGVKVYGEQRGAAVADFDNDGRIDLVVSQNGAPTTLYRNISAEPGLKLEQVIPVGAKVRVQYEDGTVGPIREIQVGSGYWSQNGAPTLGAGEGAKTIIIKWPDGSESQLASDDGESVVIVRRD
ncbi:MAG TPA: CRTAC1 family protein [Candidatus Marinimicrobia bacterium]|nr:CRTAC1 family protein [Candidatus Neomarinimicrobiota bacterium]